MRSLILIFSAVLALTLPGAPIGATPVTCTGLFISEYVEGSSNNKAIEIFNGTGQAVDLAGHSLEFYFNGATTPSATISLAGALPDGDVYVFKSKGCEGASGGTWTRAMGRAVTTHGGCSKRSDWLRGSPARYYPRPAIRTC